MSYFAKPNFIIYDEWFDEDLEKDKINIKNKKIKTDFNIHEFFYEQSTYKVGASENNLQLDIKVNKKEIINDNYIEIISNKNNSLSNKKFSFLKKYTKNKLKFGISKKIIYSLTIFGFIIIFGSIIFNISSSRKSESNITKRSLSIEKNFILQRDR